MPYKLKNINGKVKALLHTGKDFVEDTLAVSAAQHIIDSGNLVESDKEGYPICVDKTWYFEGEPVAQEKTKEAEKAEVSSAYGTFGKHDKGRKR